MGRLQLKILDLGEMTFRKAELICTPDPTEMVISPTLAVLIRHPRVGYILYDTGNDPHWRETYNAAMKQTYPITRLVSIEDALWKEGLTPSDISCLIVSHLHFDHAGGLRQFCKTPAGGHVIVSQLELESALRHCQDPGSAYMSPLFCDLPGITFQPVADSCEVAEGVSLFLQHCHTAGLMGLRVDLAEAGTVLFTSDSVYTAASDQNRLPPGGAINRSTEEFYRNLEQLHAMRTACNGTFFYGHDIDQARCWQEKGWIV